MKCFPSSITEQDPLPHSHLFLCPSPHTKTCRVIGTDVEPSSFGALVWNFLVSVFQRLIIGLLHRCPWYSYPAPLPSPSFKGNKTFCCFIIKVSLCMPRTNTREYSLPFWFHTKGFCAFQWFQWCFHLPTLDNHCLKLSKQSVGSQCWHFMETYWSSVTHERTPHFQTQMHSDLCHQSCFRRKEGSFVGQTRSHL